MSNIPKMGHLPTPDYVVDFSATLETQQFSPQAGHQPRPAWRIFWLRHFGPVTSAEHKAMRPKEPNCRDWFKGWKLNLEETLRISSWNMYLSRNIGECFFGPILDSLPSCTIDVKNDVILMLSGSKNDKRYPSSQFTQFTPSPFTETAYIIRCRIASLSSMSGTERLQALQSTSKWRHPLSFVGIFGGMNHHQKPSISHSRPSGVQMAKKIRSVKSKPRPSLQNSKPVLAVP